MPRGDYQENQFGARAWPQGLFELSATQKQRLGVHRKLDDGREFVYCKATAAQIAAGICVSKAHVPVDGTIAAADAAIDLVGVREVTVTIAGATLNLYQDGELVVKAGTNIGCKYKVRSNSITNVPATGRATFQLYDKLAATWVAASTTIAAHQNPYKDVLINPAVADENAVTQEKVVGVTTRVVPASNYFWAQKKGLAALILDVDAAAGAEANEMQIVQGTTQGRGAVIIPLETTFFWGTQIIGHTLEQADLTDAEASLVMLTIE